MNKQIHRYRQQLQTIRASYHRVSPNKLSLTNSHTSQSDILKVCRRKRTKKYKLLIQLAMLGFIAWGGVLFVSYIIHNQNGGNQVSRSLQNLSTISTKTDVLVLSDLNILQTAMPTSGSLKQANNASNVKELAQQLQQIRMHNILRTSNWVKPITANKEIVTVTGSQAFASISGKQANYKRNLVKAWEKDFLLIKN